MRANIVDNKWIYIDNLTPTEDDLLWDVFSIAIPTQYIDISQLGGWDGIYRKYNRVKKRIARPYLGLLRRVCVDHDVPLTVRDCRDPWKHKPLEPHQVTADLLAGITLHDYQVEAIKQACRVECGIFDVPTGGGKGEIICGICKAIQCPTVIMADQTVVVDQLKRRLELRDVAEEVGVFYAGRRPNGEMVVVGLIQSLNTPSKPPQRPRRGPDERDDEYATRIERWRSAVSGHKTRVSNAAKLRKYIKDSEMIIVDECVEGSAIIATNRGDMRADELYSCVIDGADIRVRVFGDVFNIIGASKKHDKSLVVTTYSGRSMAVSPNHLFAVFNGSLSFKHARNLVQDDALLCCGDIDKTAIYKCVSLWASMLGFDALSEIVGHKVTLQGTSEHMVREWYHILSDIVNSEFASADDIAHALHVSDEIVARLLSIPVDDVTDDDWFTYLARVRDGIAVSKEHIDLMPYQLELVQSVNVGDEIDMYDFTVDRASCFEANGFLVHNCDKASSGQYKTLFRHWFNGRRRYGFSATPFDKSKPVEAMTVQEHIGSIIFKVPRRKLEKLGQIVPCEYYMIAINGNIHESSTFDVAYNKWLTDNTNLHNKIAVLCGRYPDDGTLILVDRVKMGENLLKAMREHGLKAEFICGKTPKRKRDEVLRAFENRELNVLIGGKIVNRGLDLAGGCENLIIATSGKLESDFIQKIGRALRRNKMGRSRIFGFFFRCNKYLYRHSKIMLRTMVDAGYKSTVLFPGGAISGKDLIKRNFMVSKNMWKKRQLLNV